MASVEAPPELYSPQFHRDEWETIVLHDLATWINGLAFKSNDFSSNGLPVIKIAEVKKGVTPQTKFTQLEFDEKYRLRNRDLLFCWSGQPETSIDTYRWSRGDGWLNQHIFKVLPNATLVDDDYFFYLMRHLRPTFVSIARNKQTTGLGHVTKGDLQNIRVKVPSRTEQRLIAGVLTAIDALIDSKLMAAETATDLAIRKFSRGTRSVRVADVATVSKGLSYKGAGLAEDLTVDGSRTMLNLGNFTTKGRLRADACKYYTGDFKDKHQLRARELVVANTDLTQAREILGRGFLVPPSLDGAIHTHHTSVVRFGDNDWMRPYLWAQLQSERFRDRAMGFATGTTVTALPVEALTDFEFLVPEHVPSDGVTDSVLDYVWQLELECDHLVRMRDVLVPGMVSGRIRVPEGARAQT